MTLISKGEINPHNKHKLFNKGQSKVEYICNSISFYTMYALNVLTNHGKSINVDCSYINGKILV